MTGLPLQGVRILALEQSGAGPFGSAHLADLGAEVIKIEPPPADGQPGGDSARQSGPHLLPGLDSHFFQTFNRNKRSLTLDVRAAEGRAILERLVAGADAVLNNLRGDLPAKLGITYADLAPVRPSIVSVHLSAYGRSGPRAAWPGYDYLMQAEAGFCALTGEPGTPPARMGLSVVDYATGATAAMGLLAALLAAARTGRGRDVDVALYDVAMHLLSYPAVWYLNAGDAIARRPRSGHPYVVPCEEVPTRDGWMFVMCVLPKFWLRLCEAIGLPELARDERFATSEARFRHRDALMEIIDGRTRTRTTAEWMAAFGGAIPAAPILDLAEALDNPFFRKRGGIVPVDHPHHPGFGLVASPLRTGAVPPARPAPALGADTDALLAEIGYGPDRIAALRAAGIV